MIVRIRFGPGPHVVRQKQRKNRRVALASASLLAPIAVMALVLGLWGVAADLKIAGDFAISGGLFSHWQVWIASALVLAFLARLLNRYGHGDDTATPPGAADRPRISI
jgi:hypothetical protein